MVLLSCLLVPSPSSSHWASVSSSVKWGQCEMGLCGEAQLLQGAPKVSQFLLPLSVIYKTEFRFFTLTVVCLST